jgi:hypothetical protein
MLQKHPPSFSLHHLPFSDNDMDKFGLDTNKAVFPQAVVKTCYNHYIFIPSSFAFMQNLIVPVSVSKNGADRNLDK